MTYNVSGGTLNLAQSIKPNESLRIEMLGRDNMPASQLKVINGTAANQMANQQTVETEANLSHCHTSALILLVGG